MTRSRTLARATLRATLRATRRAAPLAAALALSAPLAAQTPSETLAAAERAFARMSVDSGQWAAFHAHLDTASVIFRPRATNGKTWYAAHRPPAPTAGGSLFWTPAHVGVSASGDLGFSIGPYRLVGVRPNTTDTVRFGGVFASVWGRRAGEPWRVLVDLGVSDSVVPVVDATAAVSVAPAGRPRGASSPAAGLAEVLHADTLLGIHFAHAASDDGLAGRAADDARLLRDGGGVRVGRDVARALAAAGDGYASTPIAGAVARAGDLAYTYGSWTRDARGVSPKREAGNYLRVWRRDGARWRLVLDVETTVPAT